MTSRTDAARPIPQRAVAVIGGGVLGLTVAHQLARRGFAVEVFEGNLTLGGLAASIDFGPFIWDRFYHCLTPGDHHLLALLEDIGLAGAVTWRRTASGFFHGGRQHSFDTALDLLRFPLLPLHDRLRFGWFVLACRYLFSGELLERELASSFLQRQCGRRGWEVVWQPLLRAKFGSGAGRISARFIWDSVNRLESSRRGVQGREKLGSLIGGAGQLVTALTAALHQAGVTLHLGAAAQRIHPLPDRGVEVVTAVGSRRFAAAILTVSNPLAARLLADLPGACERLQRVEYLGVAVAGVVLRRSISPFYILNIADPAIELTGMIGTSNLVQEGTFGEFHLCYLPRYLLADDPAWNRDTPAWEGYFLAQLRRLAPQLAESEVVALKVSTARHVQPLLSCNYRERMPGLRQGHPGIWLVNTSQCYQGPINLDLVVGHARRSLDEIVPQLVG